MEIRVDIIDENSISTNDNCVFHSVKMRRTVTVNKVFKCSDSKCSAKITLNPECTKILSADVQHKHIAPAKSSLKNQKKSTPHNTSLNSKNKSVNNSISDKKILPGQKKKQSNVLIDNAVNTSNSATSQSCLDKDKVNNHDKSDTINSLADSITNDIVKQLNASSIPLNKRIVELEEKNKYLCSKLNELTSNRVSTSNNHTADPSSCIDRCKQINRIFIFSDSHGRDLGSILRLNYVHPNCQVFTMIKPNARFADVVSSIPDLCRDANKNDVIFVIAGSNNLPNLGPDLNVELYLGCLQPLTLVSNVVICSIPTRYDNPNLYRNINRANSFLKKQTTDHIGKFFECDQFLRRSFFTRHGLHMNKRGKRIFALKCALFFDEHVHNASATDVPRENTITLEADTMSPGDSTFGSFVIHRPRTSLLPVPKSSDLSVLTACNTPSNPSADVQIVHDAYLTAKSTELMDEDQEMSMIPVVMGNRFERHEMDFREISSTPII